MSNLPALTQTVRWAVEHLRDQRRKLLLMLINSSDA